MPVIILCVIGCGPQPAVHDLGEFAIGTAADTILSDGDPLIAEAGCQGGSHSFLWLSLRDARSVALVAEIEIVDENEEIVAQQQIAHFADDPSEPNRLNVDRLMIFMNDFGVITEGPVELRARIWDRPGLFAPIIFERTVWLQNAPNPGGLCGQFG